MSFFIADLHNDLRQARLTRRGATVGEGAKTGLHKAYLRMPRIELPAPSAPVVSLADALLSRASAYASRAAALSAEDLGTLFGLALGMRAGRAQRTYPSGGALYPIEAYLVVSKESGIGPGVYHYNPTLHALERLWEVPAHIEAEDLVLRPDERLHASGLVVLTGVWGRSAAKYGDFAYVLALLEAGHISQNLLLTATALGLSTRPLAAFDSPAIETLLDLDPAHEQVVLTILLAKPPRA